MPKVNVTRTVKCSADRAYQILADVGSYKEFLPFVKESAIGPQTPAAGGKANAKASLRVRAKKIGIDERFTSEVIFDPVNRTLAMNSSDGPLKRLVSDWTIRPINASSCELTLNTDITLKSLTLQFVLSGAMDFVVRKLFTAFEERAVSQAALA